METVKAFLEGLKLARKQSHKNLTIFPLVASVQGVPDYFTLEEAMGSGLVLITEVSEEGQVPQLKLSNSSPKPVLIVAGEELVGAKQNRIVNVSIMVAGKCEMLIPVSCVEHGRWAYRSRQFESGGKMMHASLRRDHHRAVAKNLEDTAVACSDQGMIWEALALKSARMGVSSPTEAMADLFQGQRDRLGDYLRAFRPVECQLGAVFAINGQLLGIECFGYQATFQRFFEKLVASYALDALDWLQEGEFPHVRPKEVWAFMEDLGRGKFQSLPTVGLGETQGLEGEVASGAALTLEGRLIHLFAFCRDSQEEEAGPRLGYSRFSQRRTRMGQ
ncbi:MAG: DUF6569 family protein [bacterium]